MTDADGVGRPAAPWLPIVLMAAGFLCLVVAGFFYVRAARQAEEAAEAAAARRAAATRPDLRTRSMPTPRDGEVAAAPAESPRDVYRLPLAVAGAGLALDLLGGVLLVTRRRARKRTPRRKPAAKKARGRR